jgi:hypothetical protein
MSQESKEYYRKVFLQSDEWKTVRSRAMVNGKSKCSICGKESSHHDAHHLVYPDNVWETRPWHLTILCRSCHDLVHALKSVCSNQAITEKQQFRLMVSALHQWLSGCGEFVTELPKKLAEAEHSLSRKELKRIACRVCGQINPDTEPRNIVAYYGIRQTVMLWPFCEDCFTKFYYGVQWPKLPKQKMPNMPSKVFTRINKFLKVEKQRRGKCIPKPVIDNLDF